MSQTYYITANNNIKKLALRMVKGDVEGIELDYSGWVDDNESVTAATFETVSGDVSATNQQLSGNVATANLNASDSGGSLIKVTATGATKTVVNFFDIRVEDYNFPSTNDYGFGCR